MRGSRGRNILVIAILAIIWGSSFMLMKRGMYTAEKLPIYSPNQVAALRLSIAAFVMLPFLWIYREYWKKQYLGWYTIVALMGSGIPAFLFTNSQQFLHASMTGILNAMTPVFTLLVGYLVFKKRVAWYQVVGVLIGLFGAIGLISLRGLGDSKNMAYSGLIMLATFSYGFSVNTISNKLQGVPPLAISAFSLIIVGIPCAIIALASGAPTVFLENEHGVSAFGYIVTLAVMGTALGNLLFFRFTQKVGALAASSITYLIPVVAILWGLYDNEPFTWMHAAWAFVILTGIYLVNKPSRRD